MSKRISVRRKTAGRAKTRLRTRKALPRGISKGSVSIGRSVGKEDEGGGWAQTPGGEWGQLTTPSWKQADITGMRAYILTPKVR